MRRISLLFLLIIGIIFTAGCELAPFIGPAVNIYVAWAEGEAHAYYVTDGKTAYGAVKRALRELDYPITTDDDNGDGQYYLVADSRDRFKITVEQVEPYVTQISIRINFMGDKPYAELIYQKLEAELDVIDYTKHRQFQPN
jgi:hypothetical protein